MKYERKIIQNMAGYVPGEQPESLDVIKLNTNENPYPPPASVLDELKKIKAESLRRYPKPNADTFCRAAASLCNLNPENIIACNGGDELIRLIITTFADPGQAIAVPEPSYSLYPVLAGIHGCRVFNTKLNSDWSLPSSLTQDIRKENCQITFVVNPHAPSGYLTKSSVLHEIAQNIPGILVIDEAYVDFVDPAIGYNTVPLVKKNNNVIILRSMSKGYSLAGIRFGYGIATKNLIRPMLKKTKDSYNTDVLSQLLSTAAIKDQIQVQKNLAAVRKERNCLSESLTQMGFFVFPSQTNFLLIRVPSSMSKTAYEIYTFLKEHQILLRYFNQDSLRDKLRITVGTPDQNNALIKVLNLL